MIANYHTHTSRCGHAGDYRDEEFVEAAIEAGFKVLGFSDHSPWPYASEFYNPGMRMHISQLEDYIESVLKMRAEYAGQIDIKLALEAEYSPDYMDWLADLRPRLDYLILGNHFQGVDEQGGRYYGGITKTEDLETYVDSTMQAMETGLYDLVAHPDFVFSQLKTFDEQCEEAAHAICEAAARLDIPLEHNISGHEKRDKGIFKGLGFPLDPFWQIAASHSVTSVIALDAHHPYQLNQPELIVEAQEYLSKLGIKVLDEDFV